MDFNAEFYIGNRRRLLESTGAPLMVLSANGLLQRTADTTFPFRQDSNFWYLTGIDEPDFILVYSAESSFVISPRRAEYRDAWDGTIDEEAIKAKSGIDEILEHHQGWMRLDLLLKKHKKVGTAVSPETYFESFGFYANPARSVLLKELKRHRSLEVLDIKKPLARLRQVKQAPEVAALQRAVDITAKSLLNVQKKIETYQFEYQVVADITKDFLEQGASGHAYTPVVAGGANAATIHHSDNSAPLPKDSVILLDIGAEVSNYSADVSRTYAIGKPPARVEEIYMAAIRVQKAAYKLLKPGVMPREYEKQIDRIMADELHRLGVLDNTDDTKKFRKLYPHLTSHFLGLDTHDSADYEMAYEPGMVLTVEPGIYIPEEGIGVRIEDDVIITKTGIEVLSRGLPSELA